mmetsp:Transcript_16331/g.35295  ORF Transcript_16331/g.35295 Transcript_16331/m.35295 type:complete len:695 (+) Transcript_16331:213-2297(+)|eukprot:CAMPEP_0172303274 /NCGR_PEP_ID=MMETSP1058-20130122/4826_1 /TAXON_ID=83371 /ORGANISM="Detonula confervacea, Strain CCMP 353" /LENGTH=694 /DNA_ID=CAMNT_0013014019 /DNA_START=172 /DNA_END=2256 /DNA_ORIENTATION=-
MSRHNTKTPSSSSSSLTQYLVFWLLLISTILLLQLPSSHAGWIDEDTPEEDRTVSPLEVVPNVRPPKHPKTDDDDEKKHHKRHRGFPTQSPTDFPTWEPTSTPSTAPSSVTPAPTQPERIYDLVFSDEFNTPHRTFKDGNDPRWTALEKNDYTNDAQHYYSNDNAYTDTKGNLVIKSEAADTKIVGFNDVTGKREQVSKHFKSAMLQSWNKFCFTGGVMEAEIALPGKHDVGGLWPAFWLLGNLARHTYVGSSEHIWPWSSSVCTEKSRTAQLVSACNRVEHFGLHKGVGRGAPEIDVFEVQAGKVKAGHGAFVQMPVGQPFASSSYQVAPGRLPRPGEGWWPGPGQWYNNLTGGMNTSLNIAFYGTYNHFRDDTDPESQDYWSDAISYNRQLNESHFGKFHKYRLEWELPDKKGNEANNYTETFGYIRWFLDDEFLMEVKGEGLNASGTGAEISSEPMYMLLNTAISSQWGFPSQCPAMCPCKTYNCRGGFQETCGFPDEFCGDILYKPAEYKVNYVRVYQDKNDPKQKVGCSTKERPTRKFIEAHEKKYMQDGDVHPLKPIQHGGGTCSLTAPTKEPLPKFCGGKARGVCQSKTKPSTCECLENWTGPHCMNPTGYDDIIWDPIERLSDLGFSGPSLKGGMGILLFLIVCALVGIFVVAPMLKKGRQRMDGYTRVRSAADAVVPEYERRVVV